MTRKCGVKLGRSSRLIVNPMDGPTRVEFWDGMERGFMMPSVTTGEQMAIWDAVATYIHDHLLSNKGVRIPTLGSFDVVTQQVQVGDEDVTIHRPTFNLARNLVVGHNLVDDKSYLPGNKELEPIKYSKVAATASVSRRKVEGCVQGTLSLFSYCLGKGQNVALLLKDIGVLLLEATKVDMRFYHHFLEALAGKDNLQKVVFQVPEVLDTMLSPMVPLASLCSSGRTIIFPRFAVEVVAKPRPNESQRAPGEDEEMRKESFPPLGQGEKVPGGFHGFPAPGSPNLTSDETSRIWEVTRNEKKRRTSHTRKLSVIQKVSSIPSKESMTQKVSSTPLSPSNKPSMTQKVSSTPLFPSKKPSMTQKVSSISSSPSKKPSMTQKVSSTPLSPSKKPSMTQQVSSTPLSPSKKPSMTQKVSSTPLFPSKSPSMTQKVSSISSSPSKRPSMTQKVSSTPLSPSKKPSMTQKVSSTPLSPSKKPSMTQKVSSISSSPSKKPSMTQKVSSTPLSPSKKPSMTQKVSSPQKLLMTLKRKLKSRGRKSGQARGQRRPQSSMGGRGGGGGGEGPGLVEQFLAEMATVKRMTMKPKRHRPRGPPTFVTPVIAVLSATSSETSLLDVPTYDVPMGPPPRP